MKHRFILIVVLLAGLFSASIQVRAQSGRKEIALTSRDTRPAAVLYDEARGYATRKFEEYERNHVPYDKQLEDRTYREQREAAARNAEQLAERTKPSGDELYYLGMLYRLAENDDKAIDAFRHFLSGVTAVTTAEHAQLARLEATGIAARKLLFDEAETFFAEYIKGGPRDIDARLRAEVELAAAYHRSNKLEQSLAHSQVAFKTVKAFEPKTSVEEKQKREALTVIPQLLSQTLLELDRKDEAITVLDELRSLAMALPSSYLYRRALVGLQDLGRPIESIKPIDRAEASKTPAPELVIKQWIEQSPVKLSELHGSVVLVDFWAHWCGPCIATFPRLSAWHTKYKDRGFVILGVTEYYGEGDGRSMNQAEEFNFLQQFKKRHRLPYGFAIADSSINDLHYGVSALPSAFLLDRNGVVRFITISGNAAEGASLEKMIQALLDEK